MNKLLAAGLWALALLSTAASAQTCPPGHPRVAPDARFQISEPVAGQPVVIDLGTGLVWKRCSEGQSGASCAGVASNHNWSAALGQANAATHAGFDDWRLPTVEELHSLVETGCHSPAINTTVFPATPLARFWSATGSNNSTPTTRGGAFAVGFAGDLANGQVNVAAKTSALLVRLVRGGPGFATFAAEADSLPDAFVLAPQTGVPLSSLRTSNTVTVAGIDTVTGIGIGGAAGSQYRINGGSWTSLPGTVVNGDTVEVRHTSAATRGTATTTTLTIGGLSADFVSTTVPDTSDLALALGDSPDPVLVGGGLTYTLTLTNAGPEAILASQTVSISASLPAGLTGCSYTPSAGTFDAGTIAPGTAGTGTWTGAALAAGSGNLTLTIACTVTASAAASLSHTATVLPPTAVTDPDCSGAPPSCAGNNTATVGTTVTRPQLTLTKTASGSSFTVGTPASFTLSLTNSGTAATAAVSTITDAIPTGLTIGTLPGGCTAAGQTVTCTVPAGLAATGSASFVIPVTATVAAAASVTNTATVSGGGDTTCPANARCTSSVTVSISESCAAISFPYTLVGADNASRVTNLRTAIQCANLNGSADSIDLNGQTLTLSNAFADYTGATGLPEVTSVITLRNGTIVRDGAAPQFRFLAMNAAADLTLDGIALQGGNLATGLAGAIRNFSGNLTLISSSITGSSAEFSGAIYHEIGVLTIIDSVLSGNSTLSTGVLTNAEGTLAIIDSTFSGNTQTGASNSAGVIFNFMATVTVAGSTFSGNSSGGGGGAIHNFAGTAHVANSAFTGNSAAAIGGALFNNNGTMTVANSRVTGNSAGNRGGGIRGQGGSLTISNSTIAGNTAPTDGGITSTGTLTLVNSILWGNGNGSTLTGATISYSLIEGGFAGTGNLNVDPLFVAPVASTSAPTSAGDYRLQSYSPATDAGNNAAVPLDTYDVNGNANTTEEAPDLAGNQRRYNDTGILDSGSGTAPIVDMGAFERQTNSVVVAANVAPTSLSLAEEGSTTGSFLIALNEAPTVNVTVQLSFDGNVQVDTGSGFGASPQTVTLTPANALTGVTVNVRAVDDAIDETSPHTSTIVTSATSSTNPGFNGLAVADVTVSITDNDTAGIVVTETGGGTAVAEGGVGDRYTVVLDSQPTADVTVNIVFDPAQLVVGGETDGTLALQFNASNWNTIQTVSVAAVDDTLVEANPDATTIVQTAASGDPLYAAVNPADVGVTIADNDTQSIAFVVASSNVAETAASHTVIAQLQVTANGTPGGTIATPMTASIDLTLGTAEAGDINLSTTSVTFPSGSANGATAPIMLAPVNDRLLEGSETLSLGLTATSAIGSTSGTHVLTIIDDETGVISFASSGSSTTESAGTHTDALPRLTISGTGTGLLATEAAVSVAITDTPGTAATPADYTRTTSSVAFAAGVASPIDGTPVAVTIANDVLVEGEESFTLGFGATAGAGVLVATGTHTVVIADNDSAQVGFAAGNDTVGEGAGSYSKPVVLTLTANGVGVPSLQDPIVVPVGFAEGSALEPEDFTLATTSVSFAAGSGDGATQNVSATLVDDAIAESAESFELRLGNTFVTSNITLGRATTTVSIIDNDTPGVTVVQSGGTTVVAEGGPSDSFTVVLSSQPTANVLIALTATEVSASPASLTFTPGNWNQVQTVTVAAIDDAIDEADPHAGQVDFALSSTDAAYNSLPVAAVSVQVADNDTAGVIITESGGSTNVTEGGATDIYTVMLSSEPTADVGIAITTGTQFSVSPGSLVFTPANWNVARTVTVTAVDDNVVEGPQSGALSHGASSADPGYNGIPVSGFTVAITDNDIAVVGFAPAAVSQTEGTSPMVFTVTLSNPVASGVTLTVNSTPGTATAADFTAITGGTVSFAPGSTTAQTVNVLVADDLLDEDDETFGLTLTGLTATGNVSLGTASASGTILDDDATPTLSITSPSQDEGNAGPTPMNFVVSLSAVSGRDVSFTRATADGSATVLDNDYVAIPAGSVTIPAGQTSVPIAVTINGDTTFEGNETFALNLTGITNATPGSLTGIGTILEDDQQPTTTVITGRTPSSTVVGQPYTVNVTVTAQSTSPTGSVTISDGSASCTAPLTTGTAPASSMSCILTSTTAGTKTLTASYTPDTTAFGASSGTASQLLSAAATTISVNGPARSRINQPTAFSFALSVNAPGAGTPTGVVTLSSGSVSCTATLPATSCNLTFATLGSRTVTASYASDGNFAASTSSGLPTLVFALADVSITKTDGESTYQPGDLIVYTVQVRNAGPDAAAQVRVQDNVPAGLSAVTWTCDASGGAVCSPSSGTGNLDVTLASLPVGALWNYTFYGTVTGLPEQIVNTATLTLPADTTIEDPNPGNNSAMDISVLESLFANGFEASLVNGPEGTARLPTAALAPVLDGVARIVFKLDDKRGEMARVYARLHLGAVEYALATRGADGRWTLGPWRGYAVDPTLSWNAELSAGSWQLTRVEIR